MNANDDAMCGLLAAMLVIGVMVVGGIVGLVLVLTT